VETVEYDVRKKDWWDGTFQSLPEKTKRIVDDKVWNHIRLNPEDSEALKLDLKGLRSYRLKSGTRIIFAICRECREMGFVKVNGCVDCKEIKDETIMLFVVGHHDVYNWFSRKRKNLLRRRC
jgi:hypothetical protein